ncbi:type II toxin-antitoxin system RnlB family antitoxin [Sulfuricurvum sp.]|uniref:type II toxin-antitoxin system RnlB family antitoxin n=1 Tax=Sulfuricurvum sp. TaxID=2025608 RepID=UPI00260F2983|nr:type II toxin-antitoxin system RnlB family antitoxin [Sulfuricurvum sp.]MDD2781230.1 type II toxin-antitoxin system RnlB family antitoxin [Sulfuricurvum sp.]
MKSKYYRINKVDDSTVLILSTSYHSPTEQLDAIEKDLSKKGFHGKVLFDLLLTNGNSTQRFFETYFENNTINKSSFKNILEQAEKVRTISNKFYVKHFDLIEHSEVLSKATKFLVKQGRI